MVRVDEFDVRVRVSDRRRTLRLTVERDASITAAVPPGVEPDELARLVKAKRRWLYGKLADHQTLMPRRPPREYVSGEGFPYLGRSYRLLLVDDAPAHVRLRRGRLELRRDAVSDAAPHLVAWYRRLGRPWLRRRVQSWATRMTVRVSELRVLPLGYRWGSCSPDGRVNIHWAAMQLQPDLIDYVLVHELAHLHRLDHGPGFWRLVERAMPDYQSRRERLRILGPDLWLPPPPGSKTG